MPESRQQSHEKKLKRSYENLDQARHAAAERDGYNSVETRAKLSRIFLTRFGSEPHAWQLDVTEAMLVGLDAVVIAGTGAGKTMPFMMPLLLDEENTTTIISPLKILQNDQAKRFQKMGLKAAPVNGDTWTSKLYKELGDHEYQAILTSPEMCLEHPEFRKLLNMKEFQQHILSIIIDEAHCQSQWGGEFRPAYGSLGKLRAFVPMDIPILATSATLPPPALTDLCKELNIDLATSFYLNLGNDRPNISYGVIRMDSASDYEALKPLLNAGATCIEDIPKCLAFSNAVNGTQKLCREIRKFFPHRLRHHRAFLHAYRTPRAKRCIMKRFRRGKIKILFATEAAGMVRWLIRWREKLTNQLQGADIPDIETVIQFGVPSSLSVWIQRAGRAGRSPTMQAQAILLAEESMFQRRKKGRKKKGKNKREERRSGRLVSTVAESGSDMEGSDSNDSGMSDGEQDSQKADTRERVTTNVEDDGKEWAKCVEDAMRLWIETVDCRRDVADEYFDNPPRRTSPTGDCCDNCVRTNNGTNMTLDSVNQTGSRPCTPDMAPLQSPSSSLPSSPSRSRNGNGKRRMVPASSKPKRRSGVRRGEHLKNVRAALERWRFRIKDEHYTPSPLTASAILPDKLLTTLASKTTIHTVADIEETLSKPWMFAQRHGQEVLDLLKKYDEADKKDRERTTREKKEAKKRKTQERREPEKLQAQVNRAEAHEARSAISSRRVEYFCNSVHLSIQDILCALSSKAFHHTPCPLCP